MSVQFLSWIRLPCCVDVDFEGGCVSGGGGRDVWELTVLSAQFFCDPKTFL